MFFGFYAVSARLVDFDNILIFFSCFNTQLVPVPTEKSSHYLNFFLQTSINVSDNSITIVLQWQTAIVIVSQWHFLQCQYYRNSHFWPQ